MIDVSQSVEGDHPHAFDFLRSDIRNADDFFAKRGVDTLGLTRTFAYVTKDAGKGDTDEEMTAEAERLLTIAESEEARDSDDEQDEIGEQQDREKKPSASDEAVFAQSYIPRALDQVYDPERDVARVLRGEGKALIYADITGVAKIQKARAGEEAKGVRFEGHEETNGEEEPEGSSGEEGSDSGSESGSDSDDEGRGDRKPRGKKHEDREEKKVCLLTCCVWDHLS